MFRLKNIIKKKKIIINLFLPLIFSINILTNKKLLYVYCYLKNFYFILIFIKSNFQFNKQLNIIRIFKKISNKFNEGTFIKFITYFFKNLTFYFLKKIKYAGKSYKIEKLPKRKFLFDFRFGHCNKSFICINFLKKKLLKKTKLYLYASNIFYFKKLFFKIIKLREWNLYTQRGLRKNKQIIYKGQGKKSSYT